MRRTRSTRGVPAVCLALLIVGAWGSPAGAIDLNAVWPDLNLPGFRVTPFVTERAEYHSNVFQTPSRAEDDVVFKTIPGVLLELPLGPHRFDFGARAEVLRWLDLDRQDTEHYFLLGNVALNFPGGLTAKLKEDLAITSDPPGTELTGRIDSTTNVVSPSVEYGLGRRFAIGTDYTWTHVDFERRVNALDRDEHLFGVTGFWKVASKTDLLANYAYGFKDFDSASSRDVTRHIGLIGVRGHLTSRLTSTFRVGWERREPDKGSLTEYNGPVASGDWVFEPTDRTRFTLVTERFVAESVFATNLWYLANMVTLGVAQQFGPKITVTARGFGGTNDYPDKAAKVNSQFAWRSDRLVGAAIGVDYQIQRWLAVGADYSHTRRDSNFNNFDFKNDVVSAKVTLSF